jgi:hypothetical protein
LGQKLQDALHPSPTFLIVIPIAIALLAIISKFLHIKVDHETSTSISDKNTEFCCRFIHVRKDILLSESISSSSKISKNNKSTIDIMGAITLSITIISFLIALQLTQTVNTAAANAACNHTTMTVLLYLIGTSVGPVIAGIFMQMYQTTIEGIVGSFPASQSYNSISTTSILMSMVSIVLFTVINKRTAKAIDGSIINTP